MIIDFDNKRDTIIFATIITTFIIAIFIVIVLGFWGLIVYSPNELDSEGRTFEVSKYGECSKEHSLVPGAENAFGYNHDVEAGWMEVWYNIPSQFPICITEDYIDQYFDITVYSYGGYHPDELGDNYITLYQPKSEKGGLITVSWDDGVETEGPYCTSMKYTASFDIFGSDFIELDSNHLPSVTSHYVDSSNLLVPEPTTDLNKWVDVSMFTSWEGCPDNNQKFKLILAQYIMFL